jgi:alpha-glucosidase
MALFIKRLLMLFLLALLGRGAAVASIQVVGSVTGVNTVTNPANGNISVQFSLSTGGTLEITPFAADVVRVRFHWVGLYEKEDVSVIKTADQWPTLAVTTSDSGGTYRIETALLSIEVEKSPVCRVHFKDKADGYYLLRDDRMEFDPDYQAVSDSSYSNVIQFGTQPQGFKLKNIKVMPPNEAYFGFGEYPAPLNRRGRIIQGWNSDTYYWQEFRNPMYMTLPFYYGVQGATVDHPAFAYGVFFNNPARPRFRMGDEYTDKYSFEAADGQMDYYFFGGGENHTMKDVLDRYSELTGRPVMLPRWALGFHQSRYSYDNQSWVQWIADQFRANDFPLDAIYLDIDYMDVSPDGYYGDNSLHQLTFSSNFANPAGMISYCLAKGVRLVPILEPWLTTGDPKWQEGYQDGHFLKDSNTLTFIAQDQFYGDASLIDFSSTPARTWWKNKVLSFLNTYPFEGLWNDLNEPSDNGTMPVNGIYWLDGRYGGESGNGDSRKWHLNEKNVFPVRETSLSYDILQTKFPTKRPYVLSRSGFAGIQRYAVGWSGDNTASWEHSRHNIGMGASVMISGQANFGHDLGGFIGDNGGNLAELLTRWTEWGVLNPVCRNHSQKGTLEREPWKFGEPYTSAMRKSIKFRYQLMPYLYTLARQSTLDGTPMNVPVVFNFISDTATYSQSDNDFMCGDFLLAAPIYTSGASSRPVYLPSGATWFYWPTDVKYSGGQTVNVGAPLGTLPLFARAGAIIPMGPSMNYANEIQPDYLDIHCWPSSGQSEFTLCEDDGETTNHLAGAFATTKFTASGSDATWTFTANARQGAFNPGARSFYLKLHDVSSVSRVMINGAAAARYSTSPDLRTTATTGWTLSAPERLLEIKMPDSGSAQTVEVTFTHFATNVGRISVAGTFNSFDPSLLNMHLQSDHVWQGDIQMNNESSVRFKFTANGSFLTHWGESTQTPFSLPIARTATLAGGDIYVSGTLNGPYRFTFNEQTRAYTIQAVPFLDTDGDGMSDAYEQSYFNDPTLALPNNDTDGDSATDLQEFLAGTNPTSGASLLKILSIMPVGQQMGITFSSVSGKQYVLEYKDTLMTAGWTQLGSVIKASAATTSVTDTAINLSGATKLFRAYRLRLAP